ncbi:MAG TPA: succinic semialdehyde dehydrogenase [Acidimicrobiales bacterium]|nr:succinic semialdehyde dehydrogenase [Acidimicrobiales bacterium]
MTSTDSPTSPAPRPTTGTHGTEGTGAGLRPGRAETDRLAALVAVGAGARDRRTVTSPLTGEAIGEVPVGTADDVAAAVARAREVQRAWAERPVRERAAVLLRYHDLVLDRQDELLDLIQAENGKARVWAFEEILDQAVTARYYARLAPRALRSQWRLSALPGLVSTREHHLPKGVIGVISPWNYPLVLAVSDALAALVAGNGVVVKPDSQTPFTALRAFELLEEAGLPAGLVQVVTGPGRTVGTAIVESTDYMMFTGSTATGRTIARQAGERLIGVSAELGGKNAMVVTGDVDLERAVEGAVVGSFANTGQLCISIERIYVEAPLADAFTDAFGARAAALRLGAEQAYGPEVGALASQDQLDKVRAHVEDAVAKGARLVAGGRHRPDIGPLFYEPTVLAGVTPDMHLYREETFGPVVAVYAVASDDEAVAAANDTEYGLNASVYTGDTARGRDIARRLRAGTVNVNDGYSSAWASLDAPMGGMKASGLGRRHGREGLLKYTESQTVAVRSRLAEKLQDPTGDPAGYARRFTAVLRAAKHLPR